MMPPRSDKLPLTRDDLIFLIMGPTGAGKSTFIKYASQRDDVKVDGGLRPCTVDIHLFKAKQTIGGKNVVFVDTPGFGNTDGDHLTILAEIADFLNRIYGRNIQLAGLIYMHRISDTRIGNAELSYLERFSSLYGETAVSAITFITTMWSDVTEEVGSKRVRELKSMDNSVLAKATYRRFDGTSKPAWDITNIIAQSYPLPTLQIQPKAGRQPNEREKDSGFLAWIMRLFGLA